MSRHFPVRAGLMRSKPLVPRPRPARRVAVLCLVGAHMAMMVPAAAGKAHDPRADRERIRRQKAEVASTVDALKASDAEVTRALDELATQVKAQEARLADAQRGAEAATQLVEATRVRQEQAERDVERMRQAVRDFAVRAYVDPTTSSYLPLLSSRSVDELARRRTLLEAATSRGRDVLDALRAARADLAVQRHAADQAAARAQDLRQQVSTKLEETTRTKDRQATLAASVEERLNTTLAEAASLASLDRELSAQIVAREAAVAARVRATAPPVRPEGGGGATGAAPRVGATVTPGPTRGGVRLATVRGITVAAEIADNLRGLLTAADGAGITLGGSGYRNPQDQVALRRAHCGTSSYAVYEMPASQCSPPTARPGSSMHERGLAVDFTYQGRVITSRSSPAFQWLAGNAARFGFYNLPSEPWHWSTNGN